MSGGVYDCSDEMQIGCDGDYREESPGERQNVSLRCVAALTVVADVPRPWPSGRGS